ncbi:MAG: DUF6089 family protein [Bacteroidota bacterium]
MKKVVLLLLVVLGYVQLSAQKLELGIVGGFTIYSGDLSADEFGIYFQEMGPAFGAFGRLNINKTFAARLGITYGRIQGDDANGERPERGLQIRSNVLEFALTGELNLFTLGTPRGTQFKPYLFGGAGVFLFNPEGNFDGEWIELQPLGTEAQGAPGYEEPYELTQLNIPLGIGARFIFNESWSLGFELGGRKLFTDHLDDISDTTVDYFDVLTNNGSLAALFSNPLIIDPEPGEAAIYDRGGEFDDWYYFGTVTLSFYLGSSGSRGGNRGPACYQF